MPGRGRAFRECLLLAVGYAGSAGCDDRRLALAWPILCRRSAVVDQKPDAREARSAADGLPGRVNDSDDDDRGPSTKKKGEKVAGLDSPAALHREGACYAIAEVVRGLFMCGALRRDVQKVKMRRRERAAQGQHQGRR